MDVVGRLEELRRRLAEPLAESPTTVGEVAPGMPGRNSSGNQVVDRVGEVLGERHLAPGS